MLFRTGLCAKHRIHVKMRKWTEKRSSPEWMEILSTVALFSMLFIFGVLFANELFLVVGEAFHVRDDRRWCNELTIILKFRLFAEVIWNFNTCIWKKKQTATFCSSPLQPWRIRATVGNVRCLLLFFWRKVWFEEHMKMSENDRASNWDFGEDWREKLNIKLGFRVNFSVHHRVVHSSVYVIYCILAFCLVFLCRNINQCSQWYCQCLILSHSSKYGAKAFFFCRSIRLFMRKNKVITMRLLDIDGISICWKCSKGIRNGAEW